MHSTSCSLLGLVICLLTLSRLEDLDDGGQEYSQDRIDPLEHINSRYNSVMKTSTKLLDTSFGTKIGRGLG